MRLLISPCKVFKGSEGSYRSVIVRFLNNFVVDRLRSLEEVVQTLISLKVIVLKDFSDVRETDILVQRN